MERLGLLFIFQNQADSFMSTSEKTDGNPEGLPDSDLVETYIDGETVYQGSFFNVEKDRVRLPHGGLATREYIRHPGAVVILPLFGDGRVLLERQFRFPANGIFLEFPAGKIDRGEDILVAAQRELKEETGYTASSWHYLTTIHNALGYSDERLIIYLAKDLHEGKAELDEEEFVQTFKTSVSQLLEWVENGTITDAKTVIGSFWLEKIANNQ